MEIFKEISDEDDLLLVAGNPFSDELGESIKRSAHGHNNIKTFLEYIPDDEIQNYIKASDLVVLPFENILTSGTVHLAMSFGKPVIAPDTGCLTCDLRNQLDLLYSNDCEFKNIMQRVDSLNTSMIGERNYNEAKKRSWSDIADSTFQVYKDVLSR
jgi:glycosyltransferase involved in cell wall biosynthesis